jgi:hypothetical protein
MMERAMVPTLDRGRQFAPEHEALPVIVPSCAVDSLKLYRTGRDRCMCGRIALDLRYD